MSGKRAERRRSRSPASAPVCDRRGALYFPDLGLLCVSDLHLEKGSSLARRGVARSAL